MRRTGIEISVRAEFPPTPGHFEKVVRRLPETAKSASRQASSAPERRAKRRSGSQLPNWLIGAPRR